LVIDQVTKSGIMDLYFNEHKTIREIAKITKKSSRDITPVLRNSEYKGKDLGNEKTDGSDARQLSKETEDRQQVCDNLPLNTKAYRLFSEGKKPMKLQ
jgi:hypothetical protein